MKIYVQQRQALKREGRIRKTRTITEECTEDEKLKEKEEREEQKDKERREEFGRQKRWKQK